MWGPLGGGRGLGFLLWVRENLHLPGENERPLPGYGIRVGTLWSPENSFQAR
jgi:hypothetical protein